jgi:alpha-mannosidase
LEDHSDTWSHGIDRFAEPLADRVAWGVPRLTDDGPLLCAWCVDGRIGESRLQAEVRRYAGEAFVELRLRVTWLETHRVLRLVWAQPAAIARRSDGLSPGDLARPSDGTEKPVHDRTLLALENGSKAGAVFPDTFSLSAVRRELRLTLLRSPVMAHHPPHSGEKERRVISDQGVHKFTFRFFPNFKGGAGLLDRHALSLHRRPVIADTTDGMPLRPGRGGFQPERAR